MAKKLRLLAIENGDIEIISAACQDGLFLAKDAQFLPKSRRFTIAFNRFAWEDDAKGAGKRVPCVISFESILGVKAKGINPKSEVPLSILNIEFTPDNEPPSGKIKIALANDYEILLEAECIDIALADIGEARDALKRPDHGA